MVTDGAPKKKKKKVSKKPAASGSAATSKSSTSTGSTSKTTTKKKKKTSSRADGGSAPARSMRGEAQPAPAEQGGSSTMLIGVVLAVAVVGGLVYMTSNKEETQATTAASATPSGSVAALPTKPSAPGAEQVPAPPDVAAPPKDAEKTESGIFSKVLKKGTGTEKPGMNDTVSVHYSGWTKDGKMFDSSIPRKRPQTFGLNGVIAGWTEGVQLMVVGEKRRFWIPGSLAYGDTPQRGRPSGQLTFDIELLEIKKAPPTPEDLKEPPADAKKTESGLVYKVLEKGEGDASPTEKDKVEVHYSGWTQSDGKMFDSSVTRGKPAKFGVTGVIKGWTEGLQLMKAGDKFRFWIPADLAYGDTAKRPGGPSGTLVFDVELISIVGSAKPATSASAAASAPPVPAPAPDAPKPAAPKPAAPAPAAPKPAAPKPAAPKPAPATPYD